MKRDTEKKHMIAKGFQSDANEEDYLPASYEWDGFVEEIESILEELFQKHGFMADVVSVEDPKKGSKKA